MSMDETKEVVLRYYDEVLNAGNVDALGELAVPDYDEHDPLPGQANGLEGLEQRVLMLRSAFRPHFTVDDVIAEQDKVVVRWTNRGTHVGEFLGMPPTGKPFAMSGIDIHRLRGGKLAEHWHVVDMFGLLQQLGLIPQPAEARV
jgi:steroid delta-isomerase-like uncharacterized protein